MKSSEERTKECKRRWDNIQCWPFSCCDSSTRPSCVVPLDGDWLHSTNIRNEIVKNGWKPDLVKNTIYGAAVYLSREKWDTEQKDEIVCCLKLCDKEAMTCFSSVDGTGTTHDHLLWYLKESGVVCGRNADNGLSTQNQRIKQHFLHIGIKAIQFTEHGRIVVAVYDPNCIFVMEENDAKKSNSE